MKPSSTRRTRYTSPFFDDDRWGVLTSVVSLPYGILGIFCRQAETDLRNSLLLLFRGRCSSGAPSRCTQFSRPPPIPALTSQPPLPPRTTSPLTFAPTLALDLPARPWHTRSRIFHAAFTTMPANEIAAPPSSPLSATDHGVPVRFGDCAAAHPHCTDRDSCRVAFALAPLSEGVLSLLTLHHDSRSVRRVRLRPVYG
jgi:hypothetical protein